MGRKKRVNKIRDIKKHRERGIHIILNIAVRLKSLDTTDTKKLKSRPVTSRCPQKPQFKYHFTVEIYRYISKPECRFRSIPSKVYTCTV